MFFVCSITVPATTTAATTQASIEISEPREYFQKSEIELKADVARMKVDRDYYQKEYLRLVGEKRNDAVSIPDCNQFHMFLSNMMQYHSIVGDSSAAPAVGWQAERD